MGERQKRKSFAARSTERVKIRNELSEGSVLIGARSIGASSGDLLSAEASSAVALEQLIEGSRSVGFGQKTIGSTVRRLKSRHDLANRYFRLNGYNFSVASAAMKIRFNTRRTQHACTRTSHVHGVRSSAIGLRSRTGVKTCARREMYCLNSCYSKRFEFADMHHIRTRVRSRTENCLRRTLRYRVSLLVIQ